MEWVPVTVIFVYLAAVLYIGIFAFRKGKSTGEDFFLASRSVGPIVFFLSLFATNMTAVAILGSSGIAYKRGIGIFGMMATSSAFVIPITLFVIGTRLWALGKRFGHMTQVAFFRDRWECGGIGTFIFALTAVMLIPYLIVSIVGGGTILEQLTNGYIKYHVAGAIVALVVMGNVFFGGMRGAVLVNVFQTLLFLSFGAIAFVTISRGMDGGLTQTVRDMATAKDAAGNLKWAWALQRTPPVAGQPGISTAEFLSYLFIPLSSIMFPHMAIMCLTAKKVTSFKKTVILYPLCIMAIWLPCVFLGAVANGQPKVNAAIAAESPDAKAWLDSGGKGGVNGKPVPLAALLARNPSPAASALLEDVAEHRVPQEKLAGRLLAAVGPLKTSNPELYTSTVKEVGRLAKSSSTDSVLLQMLKLYVPPLLAGLLAAGIISAVMGSDCHQILAMSTMFTKDIFDYYGGRKRFGERGTVFVGRLFIVVANGIAYAIAWFKPQIFELAVSYAFSGFASLAPVMLAALFWKRSTKWGALASAVFVALAIAGTFYLEQHFGLPKGTAPAPVTIWAPGGHPLLALNPLGKLFVSGYLPVVPMVLGSALCMVLFSLLTRPPTRQTIEKYFPARFDAGAGPADLTAPIPAPRPA